MNESLKTVILNFTTLIIESSTIFSSLSFSIFFSIFDTQEKLLSQRFISRHDCARLRRSAITIPRPNKFSIRYIAMLLLLTVPRRESKVALEQKRKRKKRSGAKRDHLEKRTKILLNFSARRNNIF